MAPDFAAASGSVDELALLASAGDRAAFARLVEAHYDQIFRICWRWSGNREDGEDVAQDVCIRLGRAIKGWRGEAAFSSWLRALCLNAVRDHARRRIRQTRLAAAAHAEALIDTGPASDADPAIALWAAVRQLPEKQRDAVLLVHGEGLSHAKAGEAMGCSESTVSWHIHEARKRLKTIMKADAND